MVLYQGDIVMDAETYKVIKSSKSSRTKRNAHRSKSSLWTSRTIPYILPPKMGMVGLSFLCNTLKS